MASEIIDKKNPLRESLLRGYRIYGMVEFIGAKFTPDINNDDCAKDICDILKNYSALLESTITPAVDSDFAVEILRNIETEVREEMITACKKHELEEQANSLTFDALDYLYSLAGFIFAKNKVPSYGVIEELEWEEA